MHVISHAIETTLETFGFMKREPTYQAFACLAESSKEIELAQTPDNWLVTQGDSDTRSALVKMLLPQND